MSGRAAVRAPTNDDIGRIGGAVLDELPEPFRGHVRDVPIRVEDFPDDETVCEMELESPFDILGLYRGIPIGHDAELGPPRGEVDMIFLYRRPILDRWCEGEETLEEIVRDTLLHEIGHHLGMDEDDLERIGLG
jgi:predicted Zn-dependent protease with MMP-like domain